MDGGHAVRSVRSVNRRTPWSCAPFLPRVKSLARNHRVVAQRISELFRFDELGLDMVHPRLYRSTSGAWRSGTQCRRASFKNCTASGVSFADECIALKSAIESKLPYCGNTVSLSSDCFRHRGLVLWLMARGAPRIEEGDHSRAA